MRYEHSFGIIPITKKDNEWHVLIIQHAPGKHWGFPKGHADPNESPQATATRELLEETGLSITKFLVDTPLEEAYFFHRGNQLVHKKVSYFIAQVHGEIHLQEIEVSDCQWVPLAKAENLLTHTQAKQVCLQAMSLLEQLRS